MNGRNFLLAGAAILALGAGNALQAQDTAKIAASRGNAGSQFSLFCPASLLTLHQDENQVTVEIRVNDKRQKLSAGEPPVKRWPDCGLGGSGWLS